MKFGGIRGVVRGNKGERGIRIEEEEKRGKERKREWISI